MVSACLWVPSWSIVIGGGSGDREVWCPAKESEREKKKERKRNDRSHEDVEGNKNSKSVALLTAR